jgi:hypothetical protein
MKSGRLSAHFCIKSCLLAVIAGVAGVVGPAGASVVDEGPGVAQYFWQSKAGRPVDGQWIVVFNDKISSAEEGLARCEGRRW